MICLLVNRGRLYKNNDYYFVPFGSTVFFPCKYIHKFVFFFKIFIDSRLYFKNIQNYNKKFFSQQIKNRINSDYRLWSITNIIYMIIGKCVKSVSAEKENCLLDSSSGYT